MYFALLSAGCLQLVVWTWFVLQKEGACHRTGVVVVSWIHIRQGWLGMGSVVVSSVCCVQIFAKSFGYTQAWIDQPCNFCNPISGSCCRIILLSSPSRLHNTSPIQPSSVLHGLIQLFWFQNRQLPGRMWWVSVHVTTIPEWIDIGSTLPLPIVLPRVC